MILLKVQLRPLDNSSKCQRQREWWGKHDRVHFISIIPVRGDSCSWQSRNLYFASENQEHRLNPCKGFSLLLILQQLYFRHSKNVFLSSDYTLISICTLLPLDQVKFLCIFGICGCSQGTSHCRALKTSPASFQPRFILLNSGNAEQGDGLIKNQRIGSIIFLVKQDRYSCLGNLHSLHNWFSFEMRMKVWS